MPNPATKTAKKEETIRSILDTAAGVFANQGYAGARMDDIADRAGVNKATIYYHIGGKQMLYGEVLHNLIGGAVGRLAEHLQTVADPETKLQAFIRTIAQTIDADPRIPPLMMREIITGGMRLTETVAQDMGRLVGLVTGIMNDGIEAGVFRPVRPLLVHLMVIGTLSLCRLSGPVRQKTAALGFQLGDTDQAAMPQPIAVSEVETLILNAVRR